MKDSLKEERLKILELLEQGKITSDDATRLLGALKVGSPAADVEEVFGKLFKSLDGFAKGVTDKVSEIRKDVEPKVKEVTKKTIEKTVTVVDDLSKTLNDTIKSMDDEESKEKYDCSDECCNEEVNEESVVAEDEVIENESDSDINGTEEK